MGAEEQWATPLGKDGWACVVCVWGSIMAWNLIETRRISWDQRASFSALPKGVQTHCISPPSSSSPALPPCFATPLLV